MESETRVQNFPKAVYISLCENAPEKGINYY